MYNFSVRDYCGNILSYPVEVSNIDRLAPAADYEVMPGDWTNKPVTIRVTATDPEPEDGYAPSGVQSVTLPDGTVVEGGTADFVADANGKYDFIITDNGGNTFTLRTEVSNIDYLAPEAEYSVTPDIWTNRPAAIHVTAMDPEPEDDYAPSGVQSITLPDSTVVEGDAADFTVSANGTYDFIITDNGGNTATLHAEVGNVDTARPTVDFHFEPLDGGDRTIITEYGKTEYYNYDIIMNASADDVGSGIERYEYKVGDGEWTVFDPADAPKFMEEQITSIVVRVWDIAGNVSEEKARDIVLDKTPPTASHTLTPGQDGKVNINLGTDGSICGVQSITRPDGSVAYGVDTLVFEVDRNGDYDFFVWDRCGNLLKYGYRLVNKGRMNKKGIPVKDKEIDPTEMLVVQEIHRRALYEGIGTHTMAEELNARGLRTHNGAKFQANTIRRILLDPEYAGYLITAETVSPHLADLQIVDEETKRLTISLVQQRQRINDDKVT